MNEALFYSLLQIWIGIALFTFLALLRITAPYGRHTRSNWGPLISNKWGWVVMEFFVLLVLHYFLWSGTQPVSWPSGIIATFFTVHYLNRSLIYPSRIKTRGKQMPLIIMLLAMVFNLMNGFFLGYYLGNFADYTLDWLWSPAFLGGALIFIAGMYLNIQSDNYLIRLRKSGETGYQIPQAGLFKYVSCPNLLGEMIEWLGFAILTWSLPGLAFYVWTVANLLPRALSHHRWYLQQFPDYPKDRKAVIPFVL